MSEKVLVTGASGFVGRRLCSQLNAAGFTVRTGVRTGADFPRASANWSSQCEGVYAVVHLAARVHVMNDSSRDPLAEFRRDNVVMTADLAQAAAAQGARRLIYLSSIKVNGEETGARPFSEEDPPAPVDAYGQSKYEAEERLKSIARSTGLEVVILRPPLIYGPGVKANFLRLIKAVDRGIPLPFARVENARSLLAVDNLADAITACIKYQGRLAGTFLVSDLKAVSTVELAAAIAYALQRPHRSLGLSASFLERVAQITGTSNAMKRLTGSLEVDSSKLRAALGWHPPLTLKDQLSTTAVWYREAKKS